MKNILLKIRAYFRGLIVKKKTYAMLAAIIVIGVGGGFYSGVLPFKWEGRILGYDRVYDFLPDDDVIDLIWECGIESVNKIKPGSLVFSVGSIKILVKNSGDTLGFLCVFKTEDIPEFEVLNKWNSKAVFSRAYLLDEETVVFETFWPMAGTTKRHIAEQIRTYIISLQKFILNVYLKENISENMSEIDLKDRGFRN